MKMSSKISIAVKSEQKKIAVSLDITEFLKNKIALNCTKFRDIIVV